MKKEQLDEKILDSERKQSIDEIVERASKGYIDNPKEVEEIVHDFMNMKMGEIRSLCKNTYDRSVNFLLSDHDLSPEVIDEITVLDFISMINFIELDFIHNETPKIAHNFEKILLYSFRSMIWEAGKYNSKVKLFLALSLDAYYSYILRNTYRKDENNFRQKNCIQDRLMVYSRLNEWSIRETELELYKEDSGLTIGEVLKFISQKADERWTPWTDIKDFEKKVLDVYSIIKNILIKTFDYAFRESFDLNGLPDKYDAEVCFSSESLEVESMKYNNDPTTPVIK